MKKFMLLFLAMFMLSGCGSDVLIKMPDGSLVPGPKQSKIDPNLRDAIEFGGTFGPMGACWVQYGPLAGLGCSILGNKVTRAVVGEDYAARGDTIYVVEGSYGEEYGSRGPTCYDPGSGGYADCDELHRRDYSRNVSYPRQYGERRVHRVEAPQRSKNMFERPVASTQSSQVTQGYDGPTINDYMSPKWAQAIPEDCRTGNWGHDSICLYGEVKVLVSKQEACNYDKAKCNPRLNFQQMAWYDLNLANELRRAQDKYAVK